MAMRGDTQPAPDWHETTLLLLLLLVGRSVGRIAYIGQGPGLSGCLLSCLRLAVGRRPQITYSPPHSMHLMFWTAPPPQMCFVDWCRGPDGLEGKPVSSQARGPTAL